MKKISAGLALALMTTLVFAFKAGTADLDKTKWLIGTWEQKTARGSVFETWTKASPKEFHGKSYVLKEKDTLVFENIKLVQQTDGLFYIPTVKNQNGGKPVSFKAKTVSASEMVFENPEHDFPQQISYKQINKDSLVAEISGTVKGKFKAQKFQMRRKN
ncbi:DUF6265 family protein [Pedobacter sp. KR3-3]|uniref:DUF6265 family protein n=1 Tax=Pedobacter albus TaxID=3113905 RepID=A0ABU7I2V6_9SPHI|nr:DUF6265 family protein [Pedobacter sp. KR3-3]MEE1943786.1 DUF6265 family protein [Pedobacter sp. KR3-3]